MLETQESREMQSEITRTKPKEASPRRRGIALILLALLLVGVVGMVGLGIDLGVAYFLKARLSQAADAAALSGARSLARGVDINAQAANAQLVATRYFNANFPNGFWGCTTSLQTPVVTQDANSKIRYVTISATATAPLYFLRVFGVPTLTIGTSAQAARRDANIMMVIDRSSSMGANGAIGPTVTAATSFVNQFAPGRDILGMVAFGGDYYLYPPTSSFGPTSSDPLATEIGKITSSGNTNSATALWIAYQQLANLNQPGALNVILFFTDGLPNGVTADMIHTVTPTTGAVADYRTNPSGANRCGPAQVAGVAPAGVMVGWFAQWSGFAQTGTTAGFFKTVTSTVSDSNDGSQGAVIAVSGSTGTGCNFTGTDTNFYKDFKQFPAYDYYGTPTWDDPNKAAYYGSAMNTITQADLNGALTSPYKLGLASKNAADFVAQRWRHGDINGIVPLVYGITLTEATGELPDPMFMLRVTNTPSGMDNNGATIINPIYDNTKPTGTYINTAEKDQLQSAFLQIASQILHLSQ
jgi:Flp pilus assembly protein TadG